MIENAIRSILLTAVAVTDVVGDRVFMNAAPQNEHRPRLVLMTISQICPHTFTEAAGYSTGRVQVSAFADTYRIAKILATTARAALDNQAGTIEGDEIGYIQIHGLQDVPRVPLMAGSLPQFGVAVDADFMIMESTDA